MRSWLHFQKLVSKLTFQWMEKKMMCLARTPSLCSSSFLLLLLLHVLIPCSHFTFLFHSALSLRVPLADTLGATEEAFTGFDLGEFCVPWGLGSSRGKCVGAVASHRVFPAPCLGKTRTQGSCVCVPSVTPLFPGAGSPDHKHDHRLGRD